MSSNPIAQLLRTAAIELSLLVLCGWCLEAATVETGSARCRRNLEGIYGAIQEFRRAHHRLPKELAELVTNRILGTNELVCPAGGGTSEYQYEFADRPLTNELAVGLNVTLQQWRQWQMGKVGSAVPLVRCGNHASMLNLAFGGRVYESGADWVDRVSPPVKKADLNLERLLAAHVRLGVIRMFPRPADTPGEQIDLTRYYNRSLRGSSEWKAESVSLLRTNRGVMLGGVIFDARAVVQLGSRNYTMLHRPAAVSNIVVGLPCRNLVFLHGTIHEEGGKVVVGRYVVHFKGGSAESVPIVYGRELADWRVPPETGGTSQLGSLSTMPHETRDGSDQAWIYTTRWANPHPELAIDRIDFVSNMTQSSPFLIAITAETKEAKGSIESRAEQITPPDNADIPP